MTIIASFFEANGYGQFTSAIVRHLIKRGIKVELSTLFGHPVPIDLQPYLLPKSKCPKVYDVIFTSVSNQTADVAKIIFTMCEVTKLPAEHGVGLKRFKHVIVPTEFSAQAIRPWNKRIHFCPLGSNMAWGPVPLSPFTFTAVATDHLCPERKRIQELVDVFSATFKYQEDVRLLLKRSPTCGKLHTFDSRVEIVAKDLNRTDYVALMHRTTVGVQVSAMEGWSLPVNECLAMGRPVICAKAGAMGDYLTPEVFFPVEHTMRRTPSDVFLGEGKVPHARIEQIGQQMKFAYYNRQEVVRRGLAAFDLAQKYTQHAMGDRFLTLCQTLLS